MLLFIMLYKVVLTFNAVDETLVCEIKSVISFFSCFRIQLKAIEQYFHVVLFIMLYKVVLTFTSLDETL